MPRAKQRTPELRDRVLEVAIATLGEEGIARFTTRRVAERAGTSVPAVYELFDDKAGLVRAMFFEGFRLLGAELAKMPVDRRSAGRSRAAGAGVPAVLPGVSEAGAGDVLAAVRRFRARARRIGGGRGGAGGVRRPDSAVRRRGAAGGRRRPTSRTYCSRWHRVWRCRRWAGGWGRRPRSSGDGSSGWRRYSTASAWPIPENAGRLFARRRTGVGLPHRLSCQPPETSQALAGNENPRPCATTSNDLRPLESILP